MTHEFKDLLLAYEKSSETGMKMILATVIALKGSSYRKPGVRMLIREDGEMTGAVSGGCVENEILKQSASVFKTGISKVISYDGRYRLGCDGTIFILIEVFEPEQSLIGQIRRTFTQRQEFTISCYFEEEFKEDPDFGSLLSINGTEYSFRKNFFAEKFTNKGLKVFKQVMKPLFRLLIFGAMHDAKKLCTLATGLGWEVNMFLNPSDPQTQKNFPKAEQVYITSDLKGLIDKNFHRSTAAVLMTHNYAWDLEVLNILSASDLKYLGILGSAKRRNSLLYELAEKNPEIQDDFFGRIFAPAGLDLGAVTPEEIAVSICAEILSVFRNTEPESLRDKTGSIHPESDLQ